jgi:hypothetical protein
MQRYFAVLAVVLLLGMVLVRAWLMRRQGINAFHFGSTDKTDFLIPPFALFYFYTVFAAAFHLPTVSRQEFFQSGIVSWVGVVLCLAGLFLLFLSLVSFGKSFRVGIDITRTNLSRPASLALAATPSMLHFGFSCSVSSWCSRTGSCWSI